MAIEINGTTGISGVNGSATTPALQGQDTDTGISFGTDEVNVVTNGTTRATFDSSGRVGIGTAAPGNYEASGDDLVVSSSGETGITIVSSTSTGGNLYFADGTTGNEKFRGWISYTHGSTDALRFGTTGDERFRITSDGTLQLRNSPGIDFSQIQTNKTGMTSETLDSYEEGTWTPQIGIAGSTSGLTYSYQLGVYSKIGNIVQVGAYVVLSSKGSNTGHVSVRNFPFASRNVSNLYVYPYVSLSNCTSTLTAAGSLEFGPGASAATITRNTTGGWSYLDNTVINNNFVVAFTFTYQT